MDNYLEYAVLLIMFWNLENFFLPSREESVADNPTVVTWKRFGTKRDLISKTMIAVKDKEGTYPSIIGVCEVENLRILKNLVYNTPLSKLGYGIVHKDSPDARGIDVALLYRREEIKILDTAFLRIRSFKTRDILYAKVEYSPPSSGWKDTVHIFVNHWPSKLGGERKSLPRRMEASNLLKAAVDSIFTENPYAKVVAMGDFNDSPSSVPMRNLCNPQSNTHNTLPQSLPTLVNNSAALKDSLKRSGCTITGTHKYKGSWEMLDQFLASGNLNAKVQILAFPHLLQTDKKYLGTKTRRTFIGPHFNAGASDHLPILLTIYLFE